MSSTFPKAYYGKTLSTKLGSTAATAILDIPTSSTGRSPVRIPIQVWIYNEDQSNSCDYTLEVYRDETTTSYGIQQGTISGKGNVTVDFAGFVLTPSDELRLTASNANDLVATVTFLEDLGGSS
mgnify:CR=1 FL=1